MLTYYIHPTNIRTTENTTYSTKRLQHHNIMAAAEEKCDMMTIADIDEQLAKQLTDELFEKDLLRKEKHLMLLVLLMILKL